MWLFILSTKRALFMDKSPYLGLVSTETALFVDRRHNLVLASTETPVFMDKTAKSAILSTETPVFMDKTAKSTILSTETAIFVDRRPKGAYVPPTNPRVATLILTSDGKTARRASKQACRVAPVVKTSSTRRICLMPSEKEAENAPSTLRALPARSRRV